MTNIESRLDSILQLDYVDQLDKRTMDELRAMKRECDEEEAALSYARRLLQGKIDLMSAELEARAADIPTAGAADIPGALSRPGYGGFRGRFPRIMVPPETRETQEVLALLADPILMDLESITEDELRSAVNRLTTVERRISRLRRRVHEQTDLVEKEITRRYASGEASVQELLEA